MEHVGEENKHSENRTVPKMDQYVFDITFPKLIFESISMPGVLNICVDFLLTDLPTFSTIFSVSWPLLLHDLWMSFLCVRA